MFNQMIESSNTVIQQIGSDNPEVILQDMSIQKIIGMSLNNHYEDLDTGLIDVKIKNNFDIPVKPIFLSLGLCSTFLITPKGKLHKKKVLFLFKQFLKKALKMCCSKIQQGI